MRNGIIMEINEVFLTLLTPEGEFLRAKKQNKSYTIGEEIHFFPISLEEEVKTTLPLWRKVFSVKPIFYAMTALIIMFSILFPIYQDNKAYAYMSIDVNPSIELGINKNLKVVKLTGYNKEGKEVISELDNWKNKDVTDITQVILSEIQKDGYLEKHDRIIISTVRVEKPEEKVEKKLKKDIEAIKNTVKKQQIEVTVVTGTEKELKKAHKLGITTGKYHADKIDTAEKQESIKEPTKETSPKKEDSKDKKEGSKEKKEQTDKQTGNLVSEEKDVNHSQGQSKKWEEEKDKYRKWNPTEKNENYWKNNQNSDDNKKEKHNDYHQKQGNNNSKKSGN